MCGTSAQDRCKILAYINIMFWIISCLGLFILFILACVHKLEIMEIFAESLGQLETALLLLMSQLFLSYGLQFYLNMILYQGAQKRDLGKINRWMKASVFFLITNMIGLVIFSIYFETWISMESAVSGSIWITWTVFCLWIVYGFRNELKIENPRVLGVVPSAIARQEPQLNV